MVLLRRGCCALLLAGVAVGMLCLHRTRAEDSEAPGRIGANSKNGAGAESGKAGPALNADVDAVLRRWENASRQLKPLSEFQRQHALQIHGELYSPHELSVAIDFHAPVSSRDLARRFHWSHSGRSQTAVHLVGVPRDHVERLFFKQFELKLDSRTNLPREIRFVQGTGKRRDETLDFALTKRTTKPILRTAAIDVPGRVVPAMFPRGIDAASAGGDETTPLEIVQELADKQKRLDRFLDRWCDRLSSIVSADAEVSRYVYAVDRRIEFCGEGTLRYRSPNRVRFEIAACGSKTGERLPNGAKANASQKPGLDDSMVFHSDGKHSVLLDRTLQRGVWGAIDRRNPRMISATNLPFSWAYEVAPASIQNLVPIFVGADREELTRLYEWRLLRESNTHLWLSATPRTFDERRMHRQLKVIVSKSTQLPEAVMCVDSSGRFESVYAFKNWQISPKVVIEK